MTRIRKEPNRYWSKEDKYKIILKVIDDCRSTNDVAKEYDISQSILSKWVRRYIKDGINGLENKRNQEIRYVSIQIKKNLTNWKNFNIKI